MKPGPSPNLSWLLKLRWGASLGQAVTILVADQAMRIPLPLAPMLGLVAVEALSNLALELWRPPVDEERLGAGLMMLDVVLFTGLLYFSGGPFNPFSFLYLVYI